MCECRNRPVKGVFLQKTFSLWNCVNKISRSNADSSGIAMVINAYGHVVLMQVLGCSREVAAMCKINVLRETKLKWEERQPLTRQRWVV